MHKQPKAVRRALRRVGKSGAKKVIEHRARIANVINGRGIEDRSVPKWYNWKRYL